MKTLTQQTSNTGIQSFEMPNEPSVLDQSPEIFSCGGVFLGNRKILPTKKHKLESLFLPNYQKEILFIRGSEVTHRLRAYEADPEEAFTQSNSNSRLRRHFKENLN